MNRAMRMFVAVAAIVSSQIAAASPYTDTITLFKNAGQSAAYFSKSYGYAVFPTVGQGGLIVGGAHGTGHVYAQGKYVGDTSLTQVSVGFQAGGQAYSQIVFFADRRSFDEFTSGQYSFDASIGATAITASAGATGGTEGGTAAASGGQKDAKTAGGYYKGVAVFTIVKGGAMFTASVGGQKFSYKPRPAGQ